MSQPPEPNGDLPAQPPPLVVQLPPEPPPVAPPPPPLLPQQAPPPTGYGQASYGQGSYVQPSYVQPSYGYAAPPPGMHFDQMSGLVLPDGTELATVGRRIGAFFLSIPLSIVTLGIGYAIWGLIVWGRGQTPALQVLGMRCWRPETGRVATWGWMALREIVGRFVEGILSFITLLLSLILMITSKDHKSLHDLIAGTVVLRDPNNVLAQK
jgi:uncharacterized RDD family membrane protein YckC